MQPLPRPKLTSSKDLQRWFETPLPENVISQISGNTSPEAKTIAVKWLQLFHQPGGFVESIGDRIKITEVSINENADEPKKVEGRVVCEVEVTQNMANETGMLHGGCTVYLIDVCSTLPLTVLKYLNDEDHNSGVSLTLNIVFHAPASIGATLRIINTSIIVGGQVMSCRGEIWDVESCRLVASAVQTKMVGSRL